MRSHIRKLIEEVQRPTDPHALDGNREPALRLASETIRLARLAASTHMILSARRTLPDEIDPPTAHAPSFRSPST